MSKEIDNVIATIKIAPGLLGFYDQVSGIRLSQLNPVAQVAAGTNCAVLRRSVKSGTILLVSGDLGKPKSLKEIFESKKGKVTISDPKPEKVKAKTAPAKKVEKQPEVVEKAKEAEELPETIVEDIVVEKENIVDEKPKKSKSKDKDNDKEIKKVAVEVDEVNLNKKGETFKLIVTEPDKVSFESSDTSIITVNKKGNITAKAEGEATVTVKAEDFVDAVVEVKVIFNDNKKEEDSEAKE